MVLFSSFRCYPYGYPLRQILIYQTDYTIKQKRIKEFICNVIQHLSYVFGRSEGTVAFLLFYQISQPFVNVFALCGGLYYNKPNRTKRGQTNDFI